MGLCRLCSFTIFSYLTCFISLLYKYTNLAHIFLSVCSVYSWKATMQEKVHPNVWLVLIHPHIGLHTCMHACMHTRLYTHTHAHTHTWSRCFIQETSKSKSKVNTKVGSHPRHNFVKIVFLHFFTVQWCIQYMKKIWCIDQFKYGLNNCSSPYKTIKKQKKNI